MMMLGYYSNQYKKDIRLSLSAGIILLTLLLSLFCLEITKAIADSPETNNHIALTAPEQAWLDKHKVWRVGVDPDFAPYEFIDQNNNHAGIGAEYLQIVAKTLGVKLEIVKGLTWSQVMEGVQSKTIDFLTVAAPTPNRLKYLAFTKPYLHFPAVVVCRKDGHEMNELADLNGRKVALVKGYAMTEQVMRQYPEIEPVFVETVMDGLLILANNKADGFVGDLASVTYKMNEYHLNNVKVMTTVDLGIPGFSMAVSKDWQTLVTIIDKILISVPAEQQQLISQRWLHDIPSYSKPAVVSPASFSMFTLLRAGLLACLLFIVLVLFFTLLKDKAPLKVTRDVFLRQTGKSQKIVIYFNVLLVIFVGLMSWWVLDNIKQKSLFDWQKSMTAIRDISRQSVSSWAQTRTLSLRYIAKNPELVAMVSKQVDIHNNKKNLFSPQLAGIRRKFITLQSEYGHIGFFIIATDGINIGSLRDSNMGDVNLINKHRPDLLARAFAGDTVFIPPIPSDVPLGGAKKYHNGMTPPTMFFATPVKSENGQVIAVLTERFDPHDEFSNFFSLAHLGKSGETYAFDKQGRMLSASRFHDEMLASGRLGRDEQSILSVTITDPTTPELSLTKMAASAVKGNKGVDTSGYNDYRGVPVLGAWLWDDELGFGIASEIDLSEALANYYQTRTSLAITLLLTLVMISTFLWLHRRTINRLGSALSQSNQNLEKQVLERTVELSAIKEEQDLIFATMSEALFVQDDIGNIVFVNQAAIDLFGYKEDGLLGQNMHETLHHSKPDGTPNPAEKCKMRCMVDDGIPVDDEVLWHKDGYAIAVEYTSKRIVQNGKFQGMVVVCHDIRERLAEQATILAREKQLQIILDSAPIAVGISNTTGHHVFGNRRLFEQIRINLGDNTQNAFVDPMQRATLIEQLNREGIVENYEVKLYAPNGNEIDTLATCIRSEYEGEPAIISWFYDISLLKQAQKQMEQARKVAEDANRTKSEFLANMSHELRTPLNAIIGMSRLALQTGLEGKLHHYIDSVYQSGELLLVLINDILDFSRIEAGRMTLEKQPFAMGDIFEHLSRLLSFKASEKGIELLLSQSVDIPQFVTGDKLRLNQILINLVTNAIKFTETGKIKVNVSIKKQEKDAITLLYNIQDSGIGLTQEQQRQLFRPFIQADSSVARKYGGSGLGLVICKHLVEMMGGAIWLESELNKGTTFSFTVVLQQADQVLPSSDQLENKGKEQKIKRAIAKLKGRTVLLAEDNEFNRDLATEILTSNGVQVVSAVNGLEVLELLEQHQITGILMDCQMPEMDGYAATKAIRKMAKYKDLPILAMTANVMAADRMRSLDAGMNDHICKPIDPNDMFLTMAKWFIRGENDA